MLEQLKCSFKEQLTDINIDRKQQRRRKANI